MIGASSSLSVYLVPGVTDMRKSIDGLSLIVSEVLELDPVFRKPICLLQPRAQQAQNSALANQWLLALLSPLGEGLF